MSENESKKKTGIKKANVITTSYSYGDCPYCGVVFDYVQVGLEMFDGKIYTCDNCGKKFIADVSDCTGEEAKD